MSPQWLIQGQLLKFLIFNIHLLKSPSKDALPLAEPRLIGRRRLMAHPLTMSNNLLVALKLINEKCESTDSCFFYLAKVEFFRSKIEKCKKKKKSELPALHDQTTLIAHDVMHEEASLLQQSLNYGLDCG